MTGFNNTNTLLTIFLFCTMFIAIEGTCWRYGHSCWGGHGKRSSSGAGGQLPSPSLPSKLLLKFNQIESLLENNFKNNMREDDSSDEEDGDLVATGEIIDEIKSKKSVHKKQPVDVNEIENEEEDDESFKKINKLEEKSEESIQEPEYLFEESREEDNRRISPKFLILSQLLQQEKYKF